MMRTAFAIGVATVFAFGAIPGRAAPPLPLADPPPTQSSALSIVAAVRASPLNAAAILSTTVPEVAATERGTLVEGLAATYTALRESDPAAASALATAVAELGGSLAASFAVLSAPTSGQGRSPDTGRVASSGAFSLPNPASSIGTGCPVVSPTAPSC